MADSDQLSEFGAKPRTCAQVNAGLTWEAVQIHQLQRD